MIGSLRGRVVEWLGMSLLLEVAGIGYRVMTTPSTREKLKVGEEAFLYIHDHIREDTHDLYGFVLINDLELFEQLIGISGIGPKAATTILSIGSAETVRRAILAGDVETLTSVPGVGKKTAQKIILELKGQLVDMVEGSPSDREAAEALQSLGYTSQQAREALKKVAPEIVDVSGRLREALKFLSSR